MADHLRVDLLGLPLDLRSASAVEAWLRRAVTTDDETCRHLVTLNPEYVMAARLDSAFAAGIQHADLVTADGIGIVLAVRALYGTRIERVTGVSLVERLSAMSGPTDAPIFLLGAAPGVAVEAKGRLLDRFPKARFAGVWDGGTPQPADDDETIVRIAASGARVVLVAYGAPGQVHWIVRNQDSLARAGVRLVIGVGGALDFLSGRVRRASEPVRRAGLEWLYRLIREPWRWRRQLALPRFALAVTTHWLAHQRHHHNVRAE